MGEAEHIALATGTLSVTVHEAGWPLDELCGFAARNNPKRGFLVVSKMLGRHWPARPSAIRATAAALAARIPADLPGPVLVVGLAETAICLGQTVHEELRVLTGRDDFLFIHSTRQQIDHPLLCRFEEAHSHATAHLIYWPALPGFTPPRSLVLVDDEVSTGATFRRAAAALTSSWPGIETICLATLTDWSEDGWQARMPRPAISVSLLRGRLDWRAAPVDATPVAAPGALGLLPVAAQNFGRLGLQEPVATPPANMPAPPSRPLRIVGTGEFTYLPFRLAERLEQAGTDVVMQATSRSPVRIGGAITSALNFADNYRTGVPNFLYNADRLDGRATWICHETGAPSIDPALIQALDAELVGWVA
jgi:orotate phosphoribosyltransferase